MQGQDASRLRANRLSRQVIGASIQVHRALGPGLLESAYEECLCHELAHMGLAFERQKAMPLVYREVKLDCGFRLDLVVEQCLIVEIKAVESLLPIHTAQLLTYLRLSGVWLGLLINFNSERLHSGIKRLVLD